MNKENKALLKILLEVSIISLFCLISYSHLKIGDIDPGLWALAFIFTVISVLDVRSYLSVRRRSDTSSIYSGRLYWLTFGGVILWAIMINLFGMIYLSLKMSDPFTVLACYIGLSTIPLVGFSWMWLIKKFKDPFSFFSRYLSCNIIMSLMLLLAIPAHISRRHVPLLELIFKYPSKYFAILIHIIVAMTLIVLYSIRIGRSRWGARLSGILVLANFILYLYIFGWKLGKLDTLGWSIALISFFTILR